jgi:enamine deaminase RidA (YjgF/YER057c/UK114 family)
MPKEHLNPAGLPQWSESFSQVVVVRGADSRTLYVSGQVSVDESGQVVGNGDLPRQATQAFRNLSQALEAAGARPEDVVRLGIYIKDYDPSDARVVRDALREVFKGPALPASTWLGVAALALEGLLIEVEATAVVESAASRR